MTKTKINFILTGGTIDNAYHQRLGKMIITKNVEKILKQLRLPHHQFLTDRLFSIDSRDMMDKHRQQIVSAILKSKSEHIVVTHGTDTMVETAKYIAKNIRFSVVKKKIILTGAMEPYGLISSVPYTKKSDAIMNIAQSIAVVEHIRNGVWIVFHGKVFDSHNTYKDYQALTFKKR